MALIPCPECKREMSDQAPACPNCGRPRAAAAASTLGRSWARTPTTSKLLALGLLAIVGYVALHAIRPDLLQSTGLAPAPRFNFDNAGGDDSCTVLGDYCMRARCTVTNVGNADGIARVAADFIEGGITLASKRTTTNVLAPGQHQAVTFDFPEATLKSKQSQYRCYEAK